MPAPALTHPVPAAGIIARYRNRLPVTEKTPIVTLHEGGTPLVPAPHLARSLGLPLDSIHLKLEGLNPTGSFKDRGMTLALSKALEEGAKGVLCASTGNTAASAAAYATRAGLPCWVLLPEGGVALGKLSQALIHGARVIAIRGNFDQALALVRDAAREQGLTIVNSMNPYRLEGQKTAAFEIVEQLDRMPTHQFMPVGNAGNITAYWKGYKELGVIRANPSNTKEVSRMAASAALPKMIGFQAAGADPLVRGRPVASPKTVASAIRIGNPVSWQGAIQARDESGGAIDKVTDRAILNAYKELARTEGVFCEPSSAAGVAGLMRYAREGFFGRMDPDALRIVCILTGHGLKDPDAPRKLRLSWKTIDPSMAALRRLL